ncbi:hypothetical protein COC46_13150 [Bacillus sp. AFS041924]|nr:hypothetical protein COC46_13150 [Bacillus sp. AFS041924]
MNFKFHFENGNKEAVIMNKRLIKMKKVVLGKGLNQICGYLNHLLWHMDRWTNFNRNWYGSRK